MNHPYWQQITDRLDAAVSSPAKTYVPMPEARVHGCHERNIAGTPVGWIIYETGHGYQLETTDAFGEGSLSIINYCPFCGARLMTPELEALQSKGGKKNREGITCA